MITCISHIPGAVYAHLDNDLSAPKIPGKTGRHPLPGNPADHRNPVILGDRLPSPGGRLRRFNRIDGCAALVAAQWLGHTNVAILDGGWTEWQRSGLPTRAGNECRPRRQFEPQEVPGLLVSAEQVERYRKDSRYILLDARSTPRFRGELEPIDPVAGHIPGAVSAPCESNVTPEGRFLSPEALRHRFENLVKSIPTENVICYCGSGITAAHNLFSIAFAGLGMGRLYAGSWSEWITDPSRPIATGAE